MRNPLFWFAAVSLGVLALVWAASFVPWSKWDRVAKWRRPR